MLKPGYKQTDLGVLPEEWEVSQLGPLLLRRPDYGINAAAVPYTSLLPAYLRITDISETGEFIKEGRASVNHPAADSYFLSENDIVLARTGASTGKSYLYNPKDGRLVYAGFLIRVKTDPQKLDARFLKFQLQTANYWQWVTVTSVRSGQPGINGNEYAQLQIPLPLLHEQKAIADTLSAVDTLLTAQRELLAKKRALKLATQQALLSGERRLAGFAGEWKEKTLGELGKTYGGLTGKGKADFNRGNQPYVPFMSVMRSPTIDLKTFEYVRINKGEKQSLVLKNDILFNTSSETPEEVGMCSVLTSEVQNLRLNSFCFGFRLNSLEDASPLFLVYYLRSPVGRDLFLSTAQGATRYNLSKTNFNALTVKLPPPAEQRAIAAILSDMDAEIEALAAQVAKTQALKQGMMQDLLTGTIRLRAGAAAPSSHPTL